MYTFFFESVYIPRLSPVLDKDDLHHATVTHKAINDYIKKASFPSALFKLKVPIAPN